MTVKKVKTLYRAGEILARLTSVTGFLARIHREFLQLGTTRPLEDPAHSHPEAAPTEGLSSRGTWAPTCSQRRCLSQPQRGDSWTASREMDGPMTCHPSVRAVTHPDRKVQAQGRRPPSIQLHSRKHLEDPESGRWAVSDARQWP